MSQHHQFNWDVDENLNEEKKTVELNKHFNSPEVRFELQGEGLGSSGEYALHGVHLQHKECL